MPSEPGFLLMAHCQNHYTVILYPIANHIAAVAEVNDPVAKRFVHVCDGPADLRMFSENLDAVADGLHRPTRRSDILRREKAVEALDAT